MIVGTFAFLATARRAQHSVVSIHTNDSALHLPSVIAAFEGTYDIRHQIHAKSPLRQRCTRVGLWTCLCSNEALGPPIEHHFAVVTTPSYSLSLIYASVRSKWRFGFSKVADSWLLWIFEWMSSIRPFRYLVVTCTHSHLLAIESPPQWPPEGRFE